MQQHIMERDILEEIDDGSPCNSPVFSLESAVCLVKHSERPWSCLCQQEMFPTQIPALFSLNFPPKQSLTQIILYTIIELLSAADIIPRTYPLPEIISIYPVQSALSLGLPSEPGLTNIPILLQRWFFKHHVCLLGTRSLKHLTPFWNSELLEGKEIANLVGSLFKSSHQIQPGDTA